MNATLTNMVE